MQVKERTSSAGAMSRLYSSQSLDALAFLPELLITQSILLRTEPCFQALSSGSNEVSDFSLRSQIHLQVAGCINVLAQEVGGLNKAALFDEVE